MKVLTYKKDIIIYQSRNYVQSGEIVYKSSYVILQDIFYFQANSGVFSTGAIAPAILRKRLIAPAMLHLKYPFWQLKWVLANWIHTNFVFRKKNNIHAHNI